MFLIHGRCCRRTYAGHGRGSVVVAVAMAVAVVLAKNVSVAVVVRKATVVAVILFGVAKAAAEAVDARGESFWDYKEGRWMGRPRTKVTMSGSNIT